MYTDNHLQRSTKLILRALAVISVSTVLGCADPEPPPAAPLATNVVEVTAIGTAFEAPDQIPSGWTTFRFKNEADMAHFGAIERMPEGYGVAEQQTEVAPIFQQGMDLLGRGQLDSALAKFGELPAWFGEITFMGGLGLTGQQRVSESTVYLEPGYYILECYVKTDGLFHSYNPNPGKYGMVKGFTVTDERSNTPEPEPTITIVVSSEGGFEVQGATTAGEHVVAVQYADQITHKNFVGHDVHLARLDPDVDLEALNAWMNWSLPGGLQTPAPVEFLGGVQEMPAGSTGYFSITLEPGRYAWIAEVDNPAEKGMLVVFDVGS